MKKIQYPINTGLQFMDTHCHLDMSSYNDDLKAVLQHAENAGVTEIITIGIDIESSQKAIQLAKKHKNIHATIGVHPHDIESLTADSYDIIQNLGVNEKTHIVGYGEIGLDYFKNYSPVSLQKKHFSQQLELAKQLQLPVIIHDRDAHDDIYSFLKKQGPFDAGGVLHCFSGDYNFAKKILDLGFHISIPGIVTFKNAYDLHEVAKKIPLSSMLLETDGPFLAPSPYRGKRNEPAFIPFIAEKISQLRNTSIEEIAVATYTNSTAFFNLNTQ